MTKFIADDMMGKVAKYLRIMGYDTIYPPPQNTINKAQEEKRIILTRSSQLAKRIPLQELYIHFTTTKFKQQLNLIWNKCNLNLDNIDLFSRCLRCNTRLIEIDKDQILEQLPPKVKDNFNDFRKCQVCSKIYWRGGHTERMVQKLEEILQIDLE